MSQLGRIGGGVLADNLERQNIDLAFKNLPNSTPVLFLDVSNRQVGFNTDILTPDRTLDVPTKIRSVGLNSDYASIPDYIIQNNLFDVLSGDILLDSENLIRSSGLGTSDLVIQNNAISSTESSDIELRPISSATVSIYSNLTINNNLYTPGNIVLQSSLIFGDQDSDTIVLDANIDSNLIPKEDSISSIGNSESLWKDFYVDLFNGQSFNTATISIGDFDNVALEQGNILYVSVNGNDSNRGEHQQNPLRTIRRALEIVESSSQAPTTIYVFPGEYSEITPLIVPENVTIKGTDIRNTIIIPDSTSDSEDVFLLNDSTTIEDITIKGFFYNSVGNTGYAFRFAPDAIIEKRSPYIKNISVITNGSNITNEDPRGFDSGDAGRGAYFDRSELNSSSPEASVLFYSATFITPGVDSIVLTNDIRVEWLNSFTYFANRGLYAINGAEVRSINSANVYGNFGIVADGANSLFYLIGHNFAYVGLGKRSDNDTSLKIEENEAVKLNGGKIYYNSIDELGKFKVGDVFFVNQETGETNLTGDDISFDGLSSINLVKDSSTTFIDFSKIDVGNLSFAGNTVFSLIGNINILSASDNINFTRNLSSDIANININKNLQLTEDLFASNLTLNGIATFSSYINSDIVPAQNLVYNLGSINNRWNTIHLTNIENNNISFDNNIISVLETDEDLNLTANGTGKVKLENIFFKSNRIDTTLSTIDFTTNNLEITSSKAIKIQTANSLLRDFSEGGIRLNTSDFVFEGFSDNAIIGFGGVYSADRQTSLTVNKYSNVISYKADDIAVGNVSLDRLFAIGISADQISMNANQIFINNSTSDLEILPNGSGIILINNVEYFDNVSILNKIQDEALTIGNTNNGYIKFNGTFGLAIPMSGEVNKSSSPALGETLYNTDLGQIEVWDGSAWIPSTGVEIPIEESEFEDITNEWTLILG
jgi:hypothetical protein